MDRNRYPKKVTVPRIHTDEFSTEKEPRAPKLPPPPRVARPGDFCSRCAERHPSWVAAVACAFDGLLAVEGRPAPDGPCFAIEARCRDHITVALVDNQADAEGKLLDTTRACHALGNGCQGRHQHRLQRWT
jgi:hypothetical protein